MVKSRTLVAYVFASFCHVLVHEGKGQPPASSASATAWAIVTANAPGGKCDHEAMESFSRSSGSASVTFTNSSIDLILPRHNTFMKHQVNVYYDAVEHASQAFLSTSFAETYDMFRPTIDFRLKPCQNVKAYNGELHCSNPQDPACFINKLHSCAIAQAVDKQVSDKFIICTMQNFQSSFPKFSDCASVCDLDYTKLEACANSYVGTKLCLDHRGNGNPSCLPIPRFEFVHQEAKLNEQNQFLGNMDAAANFVQILCYNLRVEEVTEIPEKCEKKMTVNIYFQSMQDSTKTQFKTLATLYQKFSTMYNFNLFPCLSAVDEHKKLTCAKDHDDNCFAGKLHSCAVDIIKDQIQLMQFFACDTLTPDKKPDFAKCAGDLKIDFEALKKCAESDIGEKLCSKNSAEAPPSKIPLVFMFNWVFSEKLNEEVQSKGPEAIFCQQLRNYDMTSPESCKKEKMRMAIYYDGLDPSFREWFMGTFAEYYDMFSPFVDYVYVPCRAVIEIKESKEVKCHGFASNCDSDKVQSCAIGQIVETQQLFRFLSCCMQTSENPPSLQFFESCAQLFGIDFKPIKECATSDVGSRICAENMQKSPESDQNFVLEFNDKFGVEDSKKTIKDYKQGVCQHLIDKKVAFPNDCVL